MLWYRSRAEIRELSFLQTSTLVSGVKWPPDGT